MPDGSAPKRRVPDPSGMWPRPVYGMDLREDVRTGKGKTGKTKPGTESPDAAIIGII